MKITFLGTGTSHGVPSIDCMMQHFTACPQGVCLASQHDARHRRTRSSLMLQWDGRTVIVDVGPDFREQCLRESVEQIDAVLISHGHADHIFGIPDIRSYTRDVPIPFFGSPESIGTIRNTFPYVFNPDTPIGGGIPRITLHPVEGTFDLFGIEVIPVAVEHLLLSGCFGYRIGPVCYIPDVKSISEAECKKCIGAEVLILNCLRRSRPHGSHLTLPESIALARTLKPRNCYFIHMSHDIHYEADRVGLEDWIHFSWDGLSIEI